MMAKKMAKKNVAAVKDKYVQRVLEAMETSSDEMSLVDYIDALSEIYSEIDSRIDAAREDAERAESRRARR